MTKKTYAEKLELYNRRMAHFHSKFTKEELYDFATAERIESNSTDYETMVTIECK